MMEIDKIISTCLMEIASKYQSIVWMSTLPVGQPTPLVVLVGFYPMNTIVISNINHRNQPLLWCFFAFKV